MSRWQDEDLILHYYGESPHAEEIEDAMERSVELRERYASLSLVLDSVEEAPVPERPAAYGSRVWHRIAPEIEGSSAPKGYWGWLRPQRQWALAAVMVLLLVTAFPVWSSLLGCL